MKWNADAEKPLILEVEFKGEIREYEVFDTQIKLRNAINAKLKAESDADVLGYDALAEVVREACGLPAEFSIKLCTQFYDKIFEMVDEFRAVKND
jgi:hypothetical protein